MLIKQYDFFYPLYIRAAENPLFYSLFANL